MMSIQATAKTRISFNSGAWQLETIGSDAPSLTVDETGVRYSPRFAAAQRLPLDGALSASHVQQVVLGWQREDESWHLGFVLAPPLSEARGSRWCALASWYDPDQDVFRQDASEAGEALAGLLGVPFTLVPPEPLAPPTPPRPLPALPLTVGMWRLDQEDGALVLTRLPRWRRLRLRHALSNAFWAMVYLAVSWLTLISPIALPKGGTLLPNPQLLPYLGLVVAAGLIGSAIFQLYRHANEVNRIVFTTQPAQMAGYSGSRLRWTFDVRQAQSLYVSEVVKKRRGLMLCEHAELNFHLGGGKFHHIVNQDDSVPQDDALLPNDQVRPQESAVYALRRANYASAWQAVGLCLAEHLQLDAWYDVRVK